MCPKLCCLQTEIGRKLSLLSISINISVYVFNIKLCFCIKSIKCFTVSMCEIKFSTLVTLEQCHMIKTQYRYCWLVGCSKVLGLSTDKVIKSTVKAQSPNENFWHLNFILFKKFLKLHTLSPCIWPMCCRYRTVYIVHNRHLSYYLLCTVVLWLEKNYLYAAKQISPIVKFEFTVLLSSVIIYSYSYLIFHQHLFKFYICNSVLSFIFQ